MELGRNLEIIMYREGLSSYELAELSEVSQVTINNIRKERKTPKIDTIYYIVSAMGYDLYLVTNDGTSVPYNGISPWIIRFMQHQQVNVKDLANLMGVSDICVYYYLRDDRFPSITILLSYISKYGYSIKLRKKSIEYDLFKPIDIWNGEY